MARTRARLDRLLVERGLVATRTKAQALVLAGRVRSGTQRLDKPGALVPADLPLQIEEGRRWVGRGGDKLAPVLPRLGVDPRERDCLDVGASTGGFSQVLLEAGARRVVALDVGRGQLDWSLRNDPRILALEGRNARYLQPSDLPFAPEIAVVDVSFISLELVLPPVVSCLRPGGEIVALAKPQFEVGRRQVGRGGIVRDAALHRTVLERLLGAARERDWAPLDVVRSPLTGAAGNVEFFLHLRPGAVCATVENIELRIAEALRG